MTGLDLPRTAPDFPPLFTGEAVEGPTDPFDTARAQAALGCDAGLVVHNVQVDRLRAAIVFAPEVTLEDAMTVVPVCGIGFQNALGALAPPEVAVHLEWSGAIRVNGARCGRLLVAADTDDPATVPNWLVVGLDLPLMEMGASPGDAPDRTTLSEEGCAGVDPVQLLEAWARHTLVWLNRWSDGGPRALHDTWRGLAHGIGEEVSIGALSGTWLGVDERFGMLLRDAGGTHLVPLSSLLEDTA